MRFLKVLLITVITAVALFIPCSAYAEESENNAVLTPQQEFVPLETTFPDDAPPEDYGYKPDMTKEQAVIFYCQTTALALIAGYLVLFKVKGIPSHEKMHRRKSR